MHQSLALKELNQFLKASTDEDMIWVLHAMNKDNEEHHCNQNIDNSDEQLIQSTINILNTLKNAEEIRKRVLDNYADINDRHILYFIDSLKMFRDTLNIRAKDCSNYKSNKRLLNFTLHSMSLDRDLSWRTVSMIQDDYFKFLYVLFISPSYSRSSRPLERIEERFCKILNEKTLHFKKFDYDDFYQWVKGYMDSDYQNARIYNSQHYTPLTPEDYKVVVNSIFDILIDTNPIIYKALKDKISNAWYQKTFRQKNKGRKHHYYLTDKALRGLEILAKKHDLTKEKIIEQLINERYTKECMDINGNHLYSTRSEY